MDPLLEKIEDCIEDLIILGIQQKTDFLKNQSLLAQEEQQKQKKDAQKERRKQYLKKYKRDKRSQAKQEKESMQLIAQNNHTQCQRDRGLCIFFWKRDPTRKCENPPTKGREDELCSSCRNLASQYKRSKEKQRKLLSTEL